MRHRSYHKPKIRMSDTQSSKRALHRDKPFTKRTNRPNTLGNKQKKDNKEKKNKQKKQQEKKQEKSKFLSNKTKFILNSSFCTPGVGIQNVQGFREKNLWLEDFRKPGSPSILGLQETHLANDEEVLKLTNSFYRIMGYNTTSDETSFFTTAPGRRGGVGILIDPRNTAIAEAKPFAREKWTARFIAISFLYYQQPWIFMNIYASNIKKEREAFFEEISSLHLPPNHSILIGGDFNVCIDRQETSRLAESPKLEQLITKFSLIDAQTFIINSLREQNRPYSWQKFATWSRQNTHRRLDRFYISSDKLASIHNLQTDVAAVRTDHKLVTIQLHPNTGEHVVKQSSPIYPWFGITKDDKDTITHELRHLLADSKAYSQEGQWTGIKNTMISKIKQLRKLSISKKKTSIRTKIRKLKAKLALSTPEATRSIKNRILHYHSKWQLFKKHFKIGARLVSGDQSTKAFFRRINSNFRKDPIRELQTEQGKIHGSHQLPNAMGQGWQEVMNPKRPRIDISRTRAFLSTHRQPLTIGQKAALMQPFQLSEVTAVFNTLKSDKAPGPDGLINNWYKDFSEVLIEPFMHISNFWLKHNLLPEDFSTCTITTLKKSSNSIKPLDFRPISLLNTDYKIFTKLIANRVRSLLPQIIHPDQAGFVPGRRMDEPISKALLAQKLGSARLKPLPNRGLILLADFSKAYDSLNRLFLWEAMRWAGFPEEFIHLIQQTYQKTTARFTVNGFESNWFPISSGIRQGCPLAPLLFIIAMEAVLEKIRKSTGITGIKLQIEGYNLVLKTSGFVDDLCIFLAKAKQLPTALHILKTFGQLSGLKLNISKSNCLWLDTETSIASYHGFSFLTDNETVRYLGIQVGPGSSNTQNWDHFIQRSQSKLFLASRRYNSLKGRVTIINSIFMAGVRFIAEHFYPSQQTIANLERLIRNFLTNYSLGTEPTPGRLPISLNILELPCKAGGLGLQKLQLELQKVQMSKMLRWLHQPRSDTYYVKRTLLALEMRNTNPYYGTLATPFTLSLTNAKTRGSGTWLTGIRLMENLIRKTFQSNLEEIHIAQNNHLSELKDLYSIRFTNRSAICEYSPWSRAKIKKQHDLLSPVIQRVIPPQMLRYQKIFYNPLIRFNQKTLQAEDFSAILPAHSTIDRLKILQTYEYGITISIYPERKTKTITRTELRKWKRIIEALWQSLPLLALPTPSAQVQLLSTPKLETSYLLPTSSPSTYIRFNTKDYSTQSVMWDQETLSFRSENLSLQIVPHPIFTRLHINTLQYRGPEGKAPYKTNQWWTTKWIKSWGKTEYTKNLQNLVQALNTSWSKEVPEVKVAITQKKPKSIWSTGTGTPSMQWLQYRVRAHRLPTWSTNEKGRCAKCPGNKLDNVGHIFWECHIYIWEILIWIWTGNRQTLNTHWQHAVLSGKLFQPPANLPAISTKDILQNIPFWEKLWSLLTSATYSIIWMLRNQRVHERATPIRQLQGVWFLKQIESRLRQIRSQDPQHWNFYTSLLKNTQHLPYHPQPPVTTHILAFFDGGSRQNPGIGGAGSWCIQLHDSKYSLHLQSLRPLQPITNNEAEAHALLNILTSSQHRNLEARSTAIDIIGDSNILIRGLNGKNRIGNKKLSTIFFQVQYLLAVYSSWTATHTKRHGNKLADYLANIAMDTTEKPALDYHQLLTHLRNDLRELSTAQSSGNSQRPDSSLSLLNTGFCESLLPSLLPLQVTSARREAKKACLTFPYRATLWRSYLQEVDKQDTERSGLSPSGIG